MKDLKILESILRKNRNRKLVWGTGLSFAGLLLLFGLSGDGLLRMISILMAAGGIAMIGLALIRYDVNKSDVLRLLRESPQDVVWVYYYRVQMMPFGVSIGQMCTLFLRLSNKEQLLLRAPESELNALMYSLRNRLPQATFGHSVEKEQLYLANPELLRQ